MTAPDISDHARLPLGPGERWWGGAVDDGGMMPLSASRYTRDLAFAALAK